MFTVYLAGYISGNKIKECIAWREKILKQYRLTRDIKFINPLSGHNMMDISKDGLTSDIPNKGIIYKDYKSVIESDLIIVNLDTFGEDRPLIGTVSELAWAWERKIPVIAFGGKEYYSKHPFLQEFITIYSNKLQHILDEEYIDYFMTK
jgi:nucleoside 2-deoxyribosyltransferase